MKTAKQLCEDIKNREENTFNQNVSNIVECLYKSETTFKVYYTNWITGTFQKTDFESNSKFIVDNYERVEKILTELGYKVTKRETPIEFTELYEEWSFKKMECVTKARFVEHGVQTEITISACCGE